MGQVVDHFGAHVGMMVAGGVPAAAAAVIALVLARRGGLHLAVRMRHHLPVPAIVAH